MAQEKKATLILELKDLASKGLKSFVDVWALANIGVGTFNQIFSKAVAFVQDSIKSFSESEQAVSRLNNALKNQGTFSDDYSQSLQDTALALSRMSGKSDEAILETQTLLTTFGLAGRELDRTTKSALDLSAGLGVDLRTATLLLGKAWAGETATLGRYGLKVDETLPPMEKFAALQEQISNRFGGRAQVEAETYAGKIQKLANSWDNLKEKIGADFVTASSPTLDVLDKLVVKVENNYQALKRFSVALLLGTMKNGLVIGQIDALRAAFQGLEEDQNRALESGNKARAKDLSGAGPTSTNAAVDAEIEAEKRKNEMLAEIELLKLSQSADKKIESLTLTNAEIEAREMESMARRLDSHNQFEDAKTLRESFYAKQRKDAVMGTLNALATFQNAKTKELAIIGKAAAISAAYINTAWAVTVALRSAPPPFNFALAAAVGAAGAGQIATIAGVQLAEGGMVMSRSGGVRATMAEAGRDEVAIPLDDPRTKERLADTFSGAGITIQVGTLIADDASLMEFARKVDEKLFALGRRSMRLS